MAVIYGLRAKDSDLYFYIGSTKHSLEHRYKQHVDYTTRGYNKNLHFVNKVSQVGWKNVTADVLVECTEDERFAIEYQWIQSFLSLGHPLTNIMHNADQYPSIRKSQSYFDEFDLQPWHFMVMLESYLFGLDRSGDRLYDAFCDVVEKLVDRLLSESPNVYLEMFQESLVNADYDQEINRQAADIYKRISEVLECD